MKDVTVGVVLDGHLEWSGGSAEDPGTALSILHGFVNILKRKTSVSQFPSQI